MMPITRDASPDLQTGRGTARVEDMRRIASRYAAEVTNMGEDEDIGCYW